MKDIVKSLFSDHEFNAKHHLGAVNSINWARILAQTVYYFLAYFHAQKAITAGSSLQFVVPTGNFGDILAGYYAKKMGLPMDSLVVATNSNDILARFWKSGRYEKFDSTLGAVVDRKASMGCVNETLSPAMDILVSSNFERLLWYLAFGATNGAEDIRRRNACETLDGWMKLMKADGRVKVPVEVLELARKDFKAERISDEQVCLSS